MCQRAAGASRRFPIVHIATWQDGLWLGLDDTSLLIACAEARLVLIAFDRATLPWHAGQVLRAGDNHGGLGLFRRIVRTTDYGYQARLLTDFWLQEGSAWDWLNRIVYLPKSMSTGRVERSAQFRLSYLARGAGVGPVWYNRACSNHGLFAVFLSLRRVASTMSRG